MRLFIAIRLTDDMRDAVRRVQYEFMRYGVRGNYTKAENLHLTLAFIGEYSDTDRVLDAIAAVPMDAFRLQLKGIGAFGDLWWVGLERSEPLAAYVRSLRHVLADEGIPFDRKRFSPHITLVRRAICGPEGMPGVTIPPACMTVNHIALMRSERGKDGMIYTELRD